MKVSEKDSKNLVVAATGVGKTVISAFDYKNFRNNNKGKVNRLLFSPPRWTEITNRIIFSKSSE